MKIQSTIIRAIETGIPPKVWDDMHNPDVIPNIRKLKEVWPAIAEQLRPNIYFCSRPYSMAVYKSRPSFVKLFQDSEDAEQLIKDLTNGVSRMYIEHYTHNNENYNKYLYTFFVTCGSIRCFAQFADFYPVGLIMFDGDDTVATINFGLNDDTFVGRVPDNLDIINNGDSIGKCVTDMYIYLCMEKYAKVETREVAPSCTCRPSLQHIETLKNDTRLKIHVRDSTWFTSIFRNEGFNVSGHFRLQPKKRDGEWTRELIYISPFQKHGYHRNASIISNTTPTE